MVGNRYVVSDLHGQYGLYLQIKEYINENDIVYALGDFGDRGPQPWRTLKAGLDDSQFIYLMGNHDLMLINAIRAYLHDEEFNGGCDLELHRFSSTGPIALLDLNGGLPTLKGWANERNREDYYQQLRNLPLEIRLAAKDGKHIIHLTHAGYTPMSLEPETVDELVWDRLHFYGNNSLPNNNLLIHGHTPVNYLAQELANYNYPYDTSLGYCIYANETKIDIDMGAHYTGQTILLNLDTFEGKIFTITKE